MITCVKDGVRMVIEPAGFTLPGDVNSPTNVPGEGSSMNPVEITGGYMADFYGISFKVDIVNC